MHKCMVPRTKRLCTVWHWQLNICSDMWEGSLVLKHNKVKVKRAKSSRRDDDNAARWRVRCSCGRGDEASPHLRISASAAGRQKTGSRHRQRVSVLVSDCRGGFRRCCVCDKLYLRIAIQWRRSRPGPRATGQITIVQQRDGLWSGHPVSALHSLFLHLYPLLLPASHGLGPGCPEDTGT